MPTSIYPAVLAFDASGAPCSTEFGDIYHSRQSGPGQAQHVFLHGNDLPARWQHERVFTIVETGFGIGLNFLVTWQAWQADATRCGHLHFVAIERHPFSRRDLETLHALYPQFAPFAAAMRAEWPPAVPGLHRLQLADGRVTLTLAFGDVGALARELSVGANAFYLDGFAPDRNPEMWSPKVMKALARLALPNATLATYTTARAVRDALAGAGFACTKQRGFAPKRDMLAGRYAPTWQVRNARTASRHASDRRAIVIGAGLAGAAIAHCLDARGWRIDVIERAAINAGSAPHAGVFQPHVSSDDAVFSRWARTSFLYAVRAWRAMDAHITTGAALPWNRSGVVMLGDDDEDAVRMRQTLSGLNAPSEYARAVTRDEAACIAGCDVAVGGTWFADAGWMRPSGLIQAQLSGLGDGCVHGREVARVERVDSLWYATDRAGAPIAQAPVLVLANSHDAMRLADFGQHAVTSIRGQLSYLPVPPFAPPRSVICGKGYVLPPIDGIAVAGATFDRDNANAQTDLASHAANLARVERLMPGSTALIDAASLDGAVGFRCSTPDRLPMIGRVVDVAASQSAAGGLAGAHLADLPRIPGLYAACAYGSRGLTWASLAAELLACQLDDEPLPLERALVDAVDPARFTLKRARRGEL
jgi:tRNA 5-methylaminomethyl-2-thiouridine biosynthesis bifunctional protein